VELADLGMQLLDLPLAIGFGVPADAGIEGARRVLQQLLLPGMDLVGMDLVALGKAGGCSRTASSAIFALKAPSILRLVFVMVCSVLSNGAADFQLSPWSQKRVHFTTHRAGARGFACCKEDRSDGKIGIRNVDVNFLDAAIKARFRPFDYSCVHPYEMLARLSEGGESAFLNMTTTLRRC
jgi:hypothetical protein